MLFTIAALSVVAGIVNAAAMPSQQESNLSTRATTHIFVCVNGGWAAPCENLELQTGTCGILFYLF
jgi:hypothetical protein